MDGQTCQLKNCKAIGPLQVKAKKNNSLLKNSTELAQQKLEQTGAVHAVHHSSCKQNTEGETQCITHKNHGWHPHVKQILSHFDIVFKWNVFSKLDSVCQVEVLTVRANIKFAQKKRDCKKFVLASNFVACCHTSGYLTETTISVFPPQNCPRFADRLHKGFDRAVVVCHATILCSSNPYSPVGGMEEVNSSWVFLCKV